jgi:hypothetical protein
VKKICSLVNQVKNVPMKMKILVKNATSLLITPRRKVIGFNVCSVRGGYTKTVLIMGTNAITAVPKIKAKEREKNIKMRGFTGAHKTDISV